jgi:Methionine biosynthesis protein MetW
VTEARTDEATGEVTDDKADESADQTAEAKAADRAYLDEVRREIDEEVRRRRAAGDFPPSFERKLDELFARFTPTGTHDDGFTDALKLADRSAYFDTQVPFGSRREPRGFTKWMLWQAEAWFVNYVVRQLNHFSSSAMRVMHLLDERLEEVEHRVEMLVEPVLPEEDALAPGADPAPFFRLLATRFSSPGAPTGRILHAECGDGSLLEALSEADLDVYGIDPGTAGADAAVRKGLEVRRDEVLGHLGSVADERLSGIVLSGCVDRMSVSERRRLLRLAELKLAPGGTLALLLSAPGFWQSRVGPVVADLSGGRPRHPETWGYLVRKLGLTEISIFSSRDGAEAAPSEAASAETASSEAGGADPEAEAFCVTARKRSSGTGGR